MALIIKPMKFQASLKVVSGTTEAGNPKTSSVSLGTLKANQTVDSAKQAIWDICDRLIRCLIYPLSSVQATATSSIEENI